MDIISFNSKIVENRVSSFQKESGDYSNEEIGNDQTKREQLFVNRRETIISEEGKKFLSSHEKFEVDVKSKGQE